MSEIKKVVKSIEVLKEYLAQILELKQNPLDPDVVAVSKMLDIVLNEYHQLVNKDEDMNKRA